MTAETIGGRLGEERRRAELFRKGFVSAIDQTVTPWLATVHGRWMPFINDSITVGDVVLWVDQADPFAWLPITTGTTGGGWVTGARSTYFMSYAHNFFAQTSRTLTNGDIFGLVGDPRATLLVGFIGPVAATFGGTGIRDNEILNEVVGGSFASFHTRTEPGSTGTWPFGTRTASFSAIKNWHNFWLRFHPANDIAEVQHTTTGTTFPTVTAPGGDWMIVYLLFSETVQTSGGALNVPAPGASWNFDAAILPEPPVGSASVNNQDDALHVDGLFHDSGDCIWGFELTTGAGPTTARTHGAAGINFMAVTVLVDSRAIV